MLIACNGPIQIKMPCTVLHGRTWPVSAVYGGPVEIHQNTGCAFVPPQEGFSDYVAFLYPRNEDGALLH